MRVIPVIDLKDGHVVRGIGGQREQYRAIQSQLVSTSAPGPVASALCALIPRCQLYVADLDAIAGAAPDWNAYQHIAACGATPIIDAGVAAPDETQALLAFAEQQQPCGASIVVALESSANPDDLHRLLARIGVDRAIFSLDLKHGCPLTDSAAWQSLPAEEIAARAVSVGFERMIVLDLAAVGTDAGPNVVDLCREIRARHPNLELISGGGVRSVADLQSFYEAGCDAVLVASALHDGRITSSDLGDCDFLRA